MAYVDESGDTGLSVGSSHTYTLGVVLIDVDRWNDAFDEMISFRRRLRDTFGVPMRAEIKANYLLRNSGPFRDLGLSPAQRRIIFRAHLRELPRLPSRAFAVVVDKRSRRATSNSEIFDLGWETVLQRLERTSTYEKCSFMITHDEGENDAVRRWVRRARRHLTAGSAFGTGPILGAAPRLVDDPIARRSDQSYFIQMADLVAYAGFRSVISPGPTIAAVCPPSTWSEIGSATHTAVAKLRPRAAPGIVLR
ncbi:DUF3800 domain-containing protein [Aeromicrobium erythreum]|nr:DUF3800 domain-containing protein [Aeromicrobium erythreum]